MSSVHLTQSQSVAAIYARIDKDRTDAAKAARARFRDDVEAGIACIVTIGTTARTRIRTDSKVASAKVMADAEMAVSRLLADATASRRVSQILIKPFDSAQESLREACIGMIKIARESAAKIEQDAEPAIRSLLEAEAAAILEIEAQATNVAEQTRKDAKLAAKRRKQYRKLACTPEHAVSEEEHLARIVRNTAQEVSAKLQSILVATLTNANAVADAASLSVHETALAWGKRIEEGLERTLVRLQGAASTQ